MKKCDICNLNFEDNLLTTVSPAEYFGDSFPDSSSFCPECYVKFKEKAQSIVNDSEKQKKDTLKSFVNS